MRMIGVVGALALVSALGGTPASGATDPACVAQARQDFVACRAQCKDDFATSRFACRACLAGRAVCLDAVTQPLQDCVGGCRATLQADKAACAPGDDACIDAAQVKAFVCRDDCREAWRADPNTASGIANCKNVFRACVRACPAQ
jgi:hypothetical protein